MSDHCNLVIEQLAADEAALRAELGKAYADAESYRAVAFAALEQLASTTMTLDRLREQHQQLLGEYRALREQVLRDEGVAAA